MIYLRKLGQEKEIHIFIRFIDFFPLSDSIRHIFLTDKSKATSKYIVTFYLLNCLKGQFHNSTQCSLKYSKAGL